MITIELRSSGGDYSTWDAMATYLRSLFPLSDDVVVNIEGGATFGTDSAYNGYITPFGAYVGNNHTIIFQTKLSEQNTPATIAGMIKTDTGAGDTINVIVRKLKLRTNCGVGGNGPYGYEGGASKDFSIEDCYIAMRTTADGGNIMGIPATRTGTYYLKNCTVALSVASGSITSAYFALVGTQSITNNIFVVHSASNFTMHLGAGSNNIGCNYGGGSFSFSGGTGGAETNPLFVDGDIVTGDNESSATVLARDAMLTDLSPCIGYAGTGVTTTDIRGKPRHIVG